MTLFKIRFITKIDML